MAKVKKDKYVAIDLGSNKTRIFISNVGMVFDQSTIIIKDFKSNKITHIGNDAKDLLGKTSSNQVVIKPICGGAITDFNALTTFIKMALSGYESNIKNSITTISCPLGLSNLEKTYLIKAIELLGPSKINVIEDAKLAIIGSNWDVNKNSVLLGIDIGGGKASAISIVGGSIIDSVTTKKSGISFDEEIIKLIRHHYNTIIGDVTAEQIKISVVSLLKENKKIKIFGYDVNTGMPSNIIVDGNIFNKILVSYFQEFSNLIMTLLEKSPKEAIKDICKNGIIITGSFAKINGVKKYFERYFGMPIHLNKEESEYATINGAIKYVKYLDM